MSPAAALLAIIPPVFAILVEHFNPISNAAISSSVQRDYEQFRKDDPETHQALVKHSAAAIEGAVEVAGLAPTFVACLTSGFGVLSEFPNPWLAVGYLLVFLAFLLFLLHYLSGLSFLQMTTALKTLPRPFRGEAYPSVVISRSIYVANSLLILFVVSVFLYFEAGHLFAQHRQAATPSHLTTEEAPSASQPQQRKTP